jgi:hypothetical protein
MKIIIKPKKKLIACIAIGSKYRSLWENNILPTWKLYCKKNKIGLVLFKNDLIEKKSLFWKKATWQRLLVGDAVRKELPKVEELCVMDIDIIINPYSPDIFKSIKKNKINLTSLRKNLPFNYKDTIRKIAFFRKELVNKKYPLDSLLNSDLKTLYKSEKLKPQKDEMCVGVMVFNVKKFSKILYNWFFDYKKNIDTTTRGGCQTILNYLILKNKYENLLDYKFQTIWLFEVASRFPYLLKYIKNKELMANLTMSILLDSYFLHFAGGGKESSIWESKDFYKRINTNTLNNFKIYQKKKLKGLPAISIRN